MNKIPARKTEYRGYLFRSSLEARWAAFFDQLGVEWRYEALDLNGYIPDFILPSTNLLIEVKPIFYFSDAEKYAEKTLESGWEDHFVIVGAHYSLDIFRESLPSSFDGPVVGAYFPKWDSNQNDLEGHEIIQSKKLTPLVWCQERGKSTNLVNSLGWNDIVGIWADRLRKRNYSPSDKWWQSDWDDCTDEALATLDRAWAEAHRATQWVPRK